MVEHVTVRGICGWCLALLKKGMAARSNLVDSFLEWQTIRQNLAVKKASRWQEAASRMATMELWIDIASVLLCVTSAALAAGLTLGLATLEPFGLQASREQ